MTTSSNGCLDLQQTKTSFYYYCHFLIIDKKQLQFISGSMTSLVFLQNFQCDASTSHIHTQTLFITPISLHLNSSIFSIWVGPPSFLNFYNIAAMLIRIFNKY